MRFTLTQSTSIKWKFAICLALSFLISSCATEKKIVFEHPGKTDLYVHSINISGNNVFSSSEIKKNIVTYEDPGWRTDVKDVPIFGAEHSYFNPLTWEKDKIRILTMYQANGYFNARIVRSRIQTNEKKKNVSLSLKIDEAKPAKIRSIKISGLQDLKKPISNINEALNLNIGDIFVQQTYLNAKDKLVYLLRNLSYAYVSVQGKVYVIPGEDVADIYFYVDLGPECKFGDISIEGLEEIEKKYVEEAVSFKNGEPYSPIAMRETQAGIYDLGVFSVVKVALASELENEIDQTRKEEPSKETSKNGIEIVGEEADSKKKTKPHDPSQSFSGDIHSGDEKERKQAKLSDVFDSSTIRELTTSDPSVAADAVQNLLDQAQNAAIQRTAISTVVPIVIRVREAKKLSIRMGVGFGVQPRGAAVKLRFDWSHRNLFGGLRKIEHFNEFGYAWADNESKLLPNFTKPSNKGWAVRSELRFTQPQFLERLTSFNANIIFKRDIQPNWTLMSPSFQVGLRRTWFGHLRTDISYNASLNFLSNLNINAAATRPPSNYTVEYLEQKLTLNYLDNIINPKKGVLVEGVVQEAFRYFGLIPGVRGSDFDYIYASLAIQGYINYTLGIEQVIAMRAKLGSIYTLGRGELAPLPQRLFGGGVDSIRSFGAKQFSVYASDGYGAFPLGGFTQAELSLEPRFLIVKNLAGIGDFWGAIYADAATILPGQFLFQTNANLNACNSKDNCVETFASVAKSFIYGVGVGLWWITPIGPVRADFAYTVSKFKEDGRFRECQSLTDSRGFCPADNYYPEDDDLVLRNLTPWSFYLGIGHTF